MLEVDVVGMSIGEADAGVEGVGGVATGVVRGEADAEEDGVGGVGAGVARVEDAEDDDDVGGVGTGVIVRLAVVSEGRVFLAGWRFCIWVDICVQAGLEPETLLSESVEDSSTVSWSVSSLASLVDTVPESLSASLSESLLSSELESLLDSLRDEASVSNKARVPSILVV